MRVNTRYSEATLACFFVVAFLFCFVQCCCDWRIRRDLSHKWHKISILLFTRLPGESYCKRLWLLLLCSSVWRLSSVTELVNSFACWRSRRTKSSSSLSWVTATGSRKLWQTVGPVLSACTRQNTAGSLTVAPLCRRVGTDRIAVWRHFLILMGHNLGRVIIVCVCVCVSVVCVCVLSGSRQIIVEHLSK